MQNQPKYNRRPKRKAQLKSRQQKLRKHRHLLRLYLRLKSRLKNRRKRQRKHRLKHPSRSRQPRRIQLQALKVKCLSCAISSAVPTESPTLRSTRLFALMPPSEQKKFQETIGFPTKDPTARRALPQLPWIICPAEKILLTARERHPLPLRRGWTLRDTELISCPMNSHKQALAATSLTEFDIGRSFL